MALISRRTKKIVSEPFWDNNPITLQVLGICSALAVTVQLKTALVMSAALTLVLVGSNGTISAMRNFIPSKIRIIVQLSVIASLVILADQLLKAYMYDMSKQLSVFVGLIITNCIVMGRAEAYAMANPVGPSLLDGFGNALGYSLVLICVAGGREILGSGSIMGITLVPDYLYAAGYVNNGLMVLAPGAFILLGLFIWIQRSISKHYESH